MQSQTPHLSPIQRVLLKRYEELRGKNPSFSMRAFAVRAGMPAGSLNQVMLGKRNVSEKMAMKIADNLLLDPQDRSEILAKFLEAKKELPSKTYVKLTQDQFEVASDWQHFAILNLITTKDFKREVDVIADRLALSPKVVSESLERLERLGLLTVNEDGYLRRQEANYRTTDDVASSAVRKSHEQGLELARESLHRDGVTERDFTWMMFTFDPAKMAEAKALIRKFQDEFLAITQNEATPSEVYRLNIQLFPLTRPAGKNQ